MELVAFANEATELLKKFRVQRHDAVAPAPQLVLFHGGQEVIGLGTAALDHPQGGFRALHGQLVQLGHGAFAAFDPKGRPHVVADDREVGHERDRVVLDFRLDLNAFVEEEHIGQELQAHMAHRLVDALADDDLVGKRPVPIFAAELEVEFVGHAESLQTTRSEGRCP